MSYPYRKYCKTRWEDEKKDASFLIKHNNLKIIALHSEMKEEINKMFGINNTIVVHNGVDFERFSHTGRTNDLEREVLGIPKDAFVIGHVGRFSEAKNHRFLVRVFDELVKMNSKSFLLLVGAGDLKKEIVNTLHSLNLDDKYLILSNRFDIPDLLSVMDIFVFPSKYEGLPVSVVEAQVTGLRCILSDYITKDCFFSSDAVPLSIEAQPSYWASVIMDFSVKGPYTNDINDFNMKKVMAELANIYTSD